MKDSDKINYLMDKFHVILLRFNYNTKMLYYLDLNDGSQ